MLQFQVPGSTTNLGHGFDCLGIALGIYNTVTVQPTADDLIAAPSAPDDGLARMAAAIRDACMQRWQCTLPGISVTVAGNVPLSRGMGSSSTVLLGIAAACQRLAERSYDARELITICAAIEGHPDNVVASCLGGCTVAAAVGDSLQYRRFSVVDRLKAVVAIPNFEVRTADARRILPASFTREEGVRALQRTALITATFAAGDIEGLRGLFTEAWHEQYRGQLNPGLSEARSAAERAGAIGTILSGSGSTVLSFCTDTQAAQVAEAVQASYQHHGITAAIRTLAFDNVGVTAL